MQNGNSGTAVKDQACTSRCHELVKHLQERVLRAPDLGHAGHAPSAENESSLSVLLLSIMFSFTLTSALGLLAVMCYTFHIFFPVIILPQP